MVEIDYERLELIVAGDIDESVRDEFNIPEMVSKAEIRPYDTGEGLVDAIIVKSAKFSFAYDPETYEQLGGIGA